MRIIEITDSKVSEMAEHVEKVLKHSGKLMQCIEDLNEETRMGERGRYGNRGGGRYGMRDEDDWEDDDDPYMGERRGRSYRTGRYIRR